MDNIKIVPIKENVNKTAVEVLEETLELVKSGEVDQLAISWVSEKGSMGGRFSGGNNSTLMWASITHSANQFYQECVIRDDD